MMKTRPILFQPEMVKAILDGRKSQTRRILKPQPQKSGIAVIDPELGDESQTFTTWLENSDGGHDYDYNPETWKCPYGVSGDRLWVREAWAKEDDRTISPGHGEILERFEGDIFYRASHEQNWPGPWKPSIHMPRKYSRLTLEITEIRVDRVRDISIKDIKAEGLKYYVDTTGEDETPDPWDVWADLWDKMHKKRGFGWSENPWVWVVEFKKGKP